MNKQEIRDEINLINKGKVNSFWYNPATVPMRGDNGTLVQPQSFYFGEAADSVHGAVPTWSEQVLDLGLLRDNAALLKSGKLNDKYAVLEDPYKGQWQNIAREHADAVDEYYKSGSMSALKSAGIGMSSDYSAIDILNVATKMLGTELREFSLEQAVTTIATPQLQIDIDTWTRFTGNKNIGEGVPPVFKLGSVARTSFDLPKHGAAVGLTFEAQARANSDIYRLNVENAISDLRRIKANLIATELETATDVAAGDWAAYTTDHSTRSPYDDIGAITDTIVSNNGTPNTIASHDKVYRDFIGNTHVHGLAQGPSHDGPFSSARVITNVPGLPGFTWYIDNEKTATILTVYDKEAVDKFQGPVRTAVWRDEASDVDMFRIFDFMLCEIVQSGKIRDLTSVTA